MWFASDYHSPILPPQPSFPPQPLSDSWGSSQHIPPPGGLLYLKTPTHPSHCQLFPGSWADASRCVCSTFLFLGTSFALKLPSAPLPLPPPVIVPINLQVFLELPWTLWQASSGHILPLKEKLIIKENKTLKYTQKHEGESFMNTFTLKPNLPFSSGLIVIRTRLSWGIPPLGWKWKNNILLS